MAGDLVVSTINGVGIGTKNVIINGNFGINQRGVSGTVVLAAGAYGHDRFKAGASGCTYTFSEVANVTTLTITAGSLVQVIEGLNLQSGTYTLSWTGTAQGKINGGSYGASGITGTATGGTNLNVEFNTGTLSLVQLEKGSTATAFEYRSYGAELALCQRYYQKSFNDGKAPTNGNSTTTFATYDGIYTSVINRPSTGGPGTANDSTTSGSNTYGSFLTFSVPMRAAATITVYGNSNGNWWVQGVGSGGAIWYGPNTIISSHKGFTPTFVSPISSDSNGMTLGHWAASAEL